MVNMAHVMFSNIIVVSSSNFVFAKVVLNAEPCCYTPEAAAAKKFAGGEKDGKL